MCTIRIPSPQKPVTVESVSRSWVTSYLNEIFNKLATSTANSRLGLLLTKEGVATFSAGCAPTGEEWRSQLLVPELAIEELADSRRSETGVDLQKTIRLQLLYGSIVDRTVDLNDGRVISTIDFCLPGPLGGFLAEIFSRHRESEIPSALLRDATRVMEDYFAAPRSLIRGSTGLDWLH